MKYCFSFLSFHHISIAHTHSRGLNALFPCQLCVSVLEWYACGGRSRYETEKMHNFGTRIFFRFFSILSPQPAGNDGLLFFHSFYLLLYVSYSLKRPRWGLFENSLSSAIGRATMRLFLSCNLNPTDLLSFKISCIWLTKKLEMMYALCSLKEEGEWDKQWLQMGRCRRN